MDISNVTNDSGTDNFDNASVIVFGVNLSAELSSDTLFSGGRGNQTSFKDGVRQGFFAVNMLSSTNSTERSRSMVMVGGTDHNSVNLVTFSDQHFAIIGVAARFEFVFFRKHRPGFVEVIRIHIDNGDNIFTHHAVDIFGGSISSANTGNVEFL